MSFVCTLVEGEFHPDVHRRENDCLAIIPIGFDDAEDMDLFYSLWVILGPRAGGALELSFFISVEDGDGVEIDQIWSGYRVRSLWDANVRRLVLINLLFSVGALLQSVNPDTVFLVTMDLDAEQRALRKYEQIARVFEMCGYSVGRYDRYEGQCVWRMDRICALGVDTIEHDVS